MSLSPPDGCAVFRTVILTPQYAAVCIFREITSPSDSNCATLNTPNSARGRGRLWNCKRQKKPMSPWYDKHSQSHCHMADSSQPHAWGMLPLLEQKKERNGSAPASRAECRCSLDRRSISPTVAFSPGSWDQRTTMPFTDKESPLNDLQCARKVWGRRQERSTNPTFLISRHTRCFENGEATASNGPEDRPVPSNRPRRTSLHLKNLMLKGRSHYHFLFQPSARLSQISSGGIWFG